MKVDFKKKEIYLSKKDVEEGVCPINRRWAVSMLRLFGPQLRKEGILSRAIRCPEVAKEAFEPYGWKVVVEGEGPSVVEK